MIIEIQDLECSDNKWLFIIPHMDSDPPSLSLRTGSVQQDIKYALPICMTAKCSAIATTQSERSRNSDSIRCLNALVKPLRTCRPIWYTPASQTVVFARSCSRRRVQEPEEQS